MTFQGNVRATFYWKSFSKKASMIALAVTFGTGFAVAAGANSGLSVTVAYVLLLNMVVGVTFVFYLTTSPQVNLLGGAARWYTLRDIWKPLALGVLVMLVFFILLLVVFGFPLGSNSWQQNVQAVLLFAFFVGFVEEYMRWTWLQVLPWGAVTANLLWVLLHPEVAPVLNGQAWSPFFAVFALLFGLLMTVIMWLYESPLPGGANKYLGPVLAATVHAGYNTLVIVWQVEIAIPGTGNATTHFGTMFSPAVTVAGFLTVGLLTGAVIWTRLRAFRVQGASTRPRG